VSALESRLLLDTPTVRIAAVACRADRSGPGAEEGGGSRVSVVLPRRGVFCVHRGAGVATADANSVVLLGAGEYRVSHPTDGGDDCTALSFAPPLSEEALGPAPAVAGVVAPAVKLLAARLTASLEARALEPLEAEEHALRLLAEVAPALSPPATDVRIGPAGRRRVERVRLLLAARPSAPWRLDQIATAVHCSPFHLARQFRAATGETIGRYLIRLRLAAALERIGAGETALARLAADLGFAHHSHLSARFRAAYGVSPSEARKIVTARLPASP
jgi:AraC family transcriptional regulator